MEPIADKLYKMYQTNPELFTDELLDNSYLEAITMSNKYEYIVDLAEEGKIDALITAANLYISGQINADAFSEDFISVDVDAYKKVMKQCDQIYEDNKNKLKDTPDDTEATRKLTNLTEKIDALHKTAESLVLIEIGKRVDGNIEKVADEEKSKTYLQLANINNYLGNTQKVDENFKDSLDSVPLCKDNNYTDPLNDIVGSLSGDDMNYSVMDTASNIEAALANSTPVSIPGQADQEVSLGSYISNYVTTKSAMLNISSIDVSEFPTVKANVQFGKIGRAHV